MPKVTDFSQSPNFPQLETEILEYWRRKHTFEQSVSSRPAEKSYVFYDGPPFATGLPHYGHLLASTTKDVIPRYQTMKGYRVERVWGWDCHGLPIENMIEKKLEIKGGKKGIEELGIAHFNQACRSEVLRLDKEWEKIIERLGRWVDFEHSYKTMDRTFMESVWWGFKSLHEKGFVYEGRKVILYCPRCSTPLSNFEIAMDNSYVDVTEPGTTYKYKLKDEADTYLLAWSTTPWNKLATPALAVNPTLTYLKIQQGEEFYILAESRLSALTDTAYTVVERLSGLDLAKKEFELHYDFFSDRTQNQRVGVVLADDFVTAEDGTGIVTLAVYGEDDYRVMKQHQIQLIEHVDEEGKLKPEVTPWAGMYLLKANPLVDADLAERGLVYSTQPHTHNVATCYRCSTRLYYAPVPAWFINIAKLRQDLITENENISWFPQHLKHGRFMKGLENAPDWNISRSRYWGTPMPIWQCDASELSADQQNYRIIGSVAELQEWAVEPEKVAALTDIHPEFLLDIEVWIDDERTVKGTRIKEVFDCWVESGSMPFAVQHYPFENQSKFEKNYPAQFVSEYIAQTRAWFYTMHVMSVAIFGKPPFENVLATGTILAEDGTKMSKSKKNYPDPMLVIDKYGVDSLRLYLMSSPVMKAENLNFSEKDVADIRRKVFVIWWNVLSFYMSFADVTSDIREVPIKAEHILDKWVMAALAELVSRVSADMESYDVVKASRRLMEFIDSLSTWYLRLSRERIKAEDNRIVSHVFGHALYTVSQLMAPFTPFFSEMLHHTLVDENTSIHLSNWPASERYEAHLNPALLADMTQIKKIVEMAHSQRSEQQLKVRQPLAAVNVNLNHALQFETELETVLLSELNVKQVNWQKEPGIDNDTLGPSVTLDTALTPELLAEGKAREVMRSIQSLRKKQGLSAKDVAKVAAPEWPREWTAEIEKKTNVVLEQGPELRILG